MNDLDLSAWRGASLPWPALSLAAVSGLSMTACDPSPATEPTPSVEVTSPVGPPGPAQRRTQRAPSPTPSEPLAPQPELPKPEPTPGLVSLAPGCDGVEPSRAASWRVTASKPKLKNAVVVVGMDALEATLVDRLVRQGDLPNMRRIAEEGFSETIHINHPIVSPSVWTTLASGYRSDEHGIPHWTSAAGHPLRSMDVKVQRIWDVATAKEKTSWVLNWLLTTPVSAIKGVMTSGEFVVVGGIEDSRRRPPGRDAGVDAGMLVWPGTFCEAANAQVPDLAWASESPIKSQFNRYIAERHPLMRDESTVRIFERLVGTQTPDLVMLFVSGADSLSHRLFPFTDETAISQMRADPTLWQRNGDEMAKHEPGGRRRLFSNGPTDEAKLAEGREIVESYYRYLDGVLGRVMAKLDSKTSTLVVVSDHGFKTASQPSPLYPAHTDYGVLMGWGGKARSAGESPKRPQDIDVAPTLYALAGLPYARDMGGRVLTEFFEVESLPRVETYKTPSTLTASTRPANFDRYPELRALGYIDEEGRPVEAPKP